MEHMVHPCADNAQIREQAGEILNVRLCRVAQNTKLGMDIRIQHGLSARGAGALLGGRCRGQSFGHERERAREFRAFLRVVQHGQKLLGILLAEPVCRCGRGCVGRASTGVQGQAQQAKAEPGEHHKHSE